MDANHVPYAYLEGRNKDLPHAGAFLHQRSIEVHHAVLLINDYWWHLDLGPFRDCRHEILSRAEGTRASQKGLLDGAVDPPDFSARVINPVHFC